MGDNHPNSDIRWIQKLSDKWLWYSSGQHVSPILKENKPICTVIMWKNDPTEQDILELYQKDIIEVLIPKMLRDGTSFPRELFKESKCEETKRNFIKMHRGFVVGYMSKPYLGVAAEEEAMIATMPTIVAAHGLACAIKWHRNTIMKEYDYEFTPSKLSVALSEYRKTHYPEKYSTILDRYYQQHTKVLI